MFSLVPPPLNKIEEREQLGALSSWPAMHKGRVSPRGEHVESCRVKFMVRVRRINHDEHVTIGFHGLPDIAVRPGCVRIAHGTRKSEYQYVRLMSRDSI